MFSSSTMGASFLGKVTILPAKQSIADARRSKPVKGELEIWTDMSKRMDEPVVGLAAAWKRPEDRHWREKTEKIVAKMRGDVAELKAMTLGLRQAKLLLRPSDKQVRIRSDHCGALDMIRDHRVGLYTSIHDPAAEEQCDEIHQLVSEIQAGLTWEEAEVKVILVWVKGHAHEVHKGGFGKDEILGNCWADYWASVVIDGGRVKKVAEMSGDTMAGKIRKLVEERAEYDESGQAEDGEVPTNLHPPYLKIWITSLTDVFEDVLNDMESSNLRRVELTDPIPDGVEY